MMKRFVVMGVAGCGKSSIGAEFAVQLGADFIDGDDLHSAANITKMAAGIPLDDADRGPWLAAVGRTFVDHKLPLVVACSALKRSYRDIIRRAARGAVTFLHLDGTRDVIAGRMAARTDHFMPPALLDSQLSTLEPPAPDENAVRVDIAQSPDAIVAELVAHFYKDTKCQ
ncbi:gluconokinase [Falsihalocynthiibacter sp. S25ZX9]|uniref:gluconokinase n=1 Tax=unclassified Falsihalocynthiibacter TaxID=2854191 RepID=UPI0035102E03